MVEPTHLNNMLVKLDHFPRDRGENKKKYLKPPPSKSVSGEPNSFKTNNMFFLLLIFESQAACSLFSFFFCGEWMGTVIGLMRRKPARVPPKKVEVGSLLPDVMDLDMVMLTVT